MKGVDIHNEKNILNADIRNRKKIYQMSTYVQKINLGMKSLNMH